MDQRCFHPENFQITWVYQVQADFRVVEGEVQSPRCKAKQAAPHVKFECADCGFSAYYSPRKAPHWFREKLAAAGTNFPQSDPEKMDMMLSA